MLVNELLPVTVSDGVLVTVSVPNAWLPPANVSGAVEPDKTIVLEDPENVRLVGSVKSNTVPVPVIVSVLLPRMIVLAAVPDDASEPHEMLWLFVVKLPPVKVITPETTRLSDNVRLNPDPDVFDNAGMTTPFVVSVTAAPIKTAPVPAVIDMPLPRMTVPLIVKLLLPNATTPANPVQSSDSISVVVLMVTVPPPLLPSILVVETEVGAVCPPEPPLVADQWAVSDQLPEPPTQNLLLPGIYSVSMVKAQGY